MTVYKLGLISLGCDKNRVDTEIILGSLKDKFEVTNDPKEADVIIVNTCGFIEASKQESINTILEMAEYKKNYKCKVLIATGCLTQRYKAELQELMPEIDIILGVNDYDKISAAIEKFYSDHQKIILCSDSNIINEGERVLTTGKNFAYLRISEGCNNNCTYCAIPKIRGPYRSRSMENIIKETHQLVSQGVSEIILIAQDTTLYGIDIYGTKSLPKLIDEISKVEGVKWIRLLYCYPEEITDELIDVIANNPKVCKYIDMPIQHISDRILRRMGRRGKKENIILVIKKLKAKVKDIALRTTFIVGFPGETEEDFQELCDFVKDTCFDNMGVFQYSPEEGTAAASMKETIDDKTKSKREHEIMLLQQKVSLNNNRAKIGKVFETLVESKDGEYYIGRTMQMAPDIDGLMYISSNENIDLGSYITVKVNEASEYDLVGDVYYESGK
ncbi:30S ribosomal protein S12 methylthiotransferase RimO [Clostridium thermarum]|uniref:30S ribosomal protein S12 methylthiotransferase RimO n=1 Tax=Clostridium thermarum TaxID=1716543 RepID=UPI00111DCCE8|nr:30S ribosomal protein S12 methylthiotransferase RimO [Clostridium thermarum]